MNKFCFREHRDGFTWFYHVLLFYLSCLYLCDLGLTTSVFILWIVGGPLATVGKWIDLGNAKLGTIKPEATSRQV